jgi:hypothetical protein
VLVSSTVKPHINIGSSDSAPTNHNGQQDNSNSTHGAQPTMETSTKQRPPSNDSRIHPIQCLFVTTIKEFLAVKICLFFLRIVSVTWRFFNGIADEYSSFPMVVCGLLSL